ANIDDRGLFDEERAAHRAFELETHVRCRVPASLRVLVQTPAKDIDQPRIESRRQRAEIDVALQDRRENLRAGAAVERLPSGEQLEEDAAEGKNIATLIGLESF